MTIPPKPRPPTPPSDKLPVHVALGILELVGRVGRLEDTLRELRAMKTPTQKATTP